MGERNLEFAQQWLEKAGREEAAEAVHAAQEILRIGEACLAGMA